MTYSKEFNIEKTDGKWEVGLEKWNGTVAEVPSMVSLQQLLPSLHTRPMLQGLSNPVSIKSM